MQAIMKTALLLVGAKGGELSAINADGEVSWSIGMTQGLHKADQYVEMLEAGESLSASGSITVKPRKDRLKRQDFGENWPLSRGQTQTLP